jgi:hypothetical protein
MRELEERGERHNSSSLMAEKTFRVLSFVLAHRCASVRAFIFLSGIAASRFSDQFVIYNWQRIPARDSRGCSLTRHLKSL